jgi:tricorn protease
VGSRAGSPGTRAATAEWRQIFREAWRFERDHLYGKNLHGADWNLVRQMYEPMLDDVVHRSDLAHLLVLLGGES